MVFRFQTAFLLGVVLAGGLACQDRVRPYPIFDDTAWRNAIQAGTRTANGAPGTKYWTDGISYRIRAELVPETARVEGHVTIVYKNRSPNPVRTLQVHLRQNLHRKGAMRAAPFEVTGGMDIGAASLSVNGDRPTSRTLRASSTVLRVPLREALAPGAEATLDMDFGFRVPKAGGAPRMGHEDHHVFFLGYWYPQVAVREDVAGWVADPYTGQGEFYMPYADYEVDLTLPHGWVVRATGEHTNQEEVLTAEVRARLARAQKDREIVRVVTVDDLGPGKATVKSPDGKLTWKFRAPGVRDFAIGCSDRYLWDATHAVVKDREGEGRDGACSIFAVYEKNARYWNQAAEFCRHAVEFTSKYVMPYPWPHMTACEGIVGGGMEFPMMTDCGTYPSRQGLYGVISHETIHMWFPMMVGNNEKRWSWMDEGITSFITSLAEAEFFERPRAHVEDVATYRGMARMEQEEPAMTHADAFPPNKPMAYGFATYGKTSAVLHQLRAQLGHDVFDRALRTYATRWKLKHPYPRDLFSTFNEVAQQDLDWYFRTWFYETWTLDQKVGTVSVTEAGSEVEIQDLGLATGPTVVELSYADGQTETKTIPASTWLGGLRSVTVKGRPALVSVRIDPGGTTLDIDTENNTWSSR